MIFHYYACDIDMVNADIHSGAALNSDSISMNSRRSSIMEMPLNSGLPLPSQLHHSSKHNTFAFVFMMLKNHTSF